MRVAFVVWPNPAHIYPLVPLAWALKAAGHEVCVASHPNIAGTTASMGLTPVSVCAADSMPEPLGPGRAYVSERADLAAITDAVGLAPDDPDREHWDVFTQYYLPAMWDFAPWGADPTEPMPFMDGLVEFARAWQPDLVLWDACMPGGAVAARVVGAAQARWWTAPDVFARSIDRYREVSGRPGAATIDHPLVETIRSAAARYEVEIDDELLFGQWTVNPQPRPIGPETSARTLSVRWIPYSGQQTMPDWLYPVPKRPRIALSLGLSERTFMEAGWDHIPALLDALAELDVEVVATLNEQQTVAVRDIPDNVRVIDFVPLDQLLPTCALLIHHGGMGTVMPAVANGVPQIVVDFVGQDIRATPSTTGEKLGRSRYSLGAALARYATSSGAGLVSDVSAPSVEDIRQLVDRVLTEPSFKENAMRLRSDLLATPAPAEFVPILERMTAAHQG